MKQLGLRLLRDPLGHFLVLGALLFGLISFFGRDENAGLSETTIWVDEAAILEFMQYRAGSFDMDAARATLVQLGGAERQSLIGDYVRQEILLREAEAIGLSRDDAVIRQRLIQRMEFALEGMVSPTDPPSDDLLHTFYSENTDLYQSEASITFTHVFSTSEEQSIELLTELRDLDVSAADALEYGQRFAYFDNYVDRTESFVESHFGPEMTGRLFSERVDLDHWAGPFASAHGFHVVLVKSLSPAATPVLEDIRDLVVTDYQKRGSKRALDEAIDVLSAGYQIEIAAGLTEEAQ